MEYKPMVYNPNENGMVSLKIIFRSGNGHGNRLKENAIKRCSISIN